MKNLKKYLFFKEISVTDFAKLLGIGRQHLSDIVNGRKYPGKELAQKIEAITEGKVKAKDLLRKRKSHLK